MSLLSDNLRYLRGLQKCSQKEVATDLIIERGRYGKYEDAQCDPPLVILKRISHHYKISIDMLITVDLRDFTEEQRYAVYAFSQGLPIEIDITRYGSK